MPHIINNGRKWSFQKAWMKMTAIADHKQRATEKNWTENIRSGWKHHKRNGEMQSSKKWVVSCWTFGLLLSCKVKTFQWHDSELIVFRWWSFSAQIYWRETKAESRAWQNCTGPFQKYKSEFSHYFEGLSLTTYCTPGTFGPLYQMCWALTERPLIWPLLLRLC